MAASVSLTATGNFWKNLLQNFPKECSYCFGYGSGVFLQKNQKPGKMIDLIFVVDDPVKWHTKNLEMNNCHYSGLKIYGPKLITSIQERMACGVYYNPFVKVDDSLIKYGVMSTTSLVEDLSKWTHMYVAGRLHKPVLDIVSPTPMLAKHLLKNREAALSAALLLNSRCIRKTDLYHTITELSYMGDFRMFVGEHPEKVKNIVSPLVPYFDRIYFPLLEKLKPVVKIDKSGIITQEIDPNGRLQQLMGLPYPIQRSLAKRIGRDPKVSDIEDAMVELSHVPNLSPYVRKAVSDVVWSSSILQTCQGILSAGVVRSIKYGLEKVKKKVTAERSPPSSLVQIEDDPVTPNPEPLVLLKEVPKLTPLEPKEPVKETPKDLIPIPLSTKQLGRKPRKFNAEEAARSSKSKKVKSFHRQTILKQSEYKEA